MGKAKSTPMIWLISLISSPLDNLRSVGLSPLMLLFMVMLAFAPLGIKNEYIISLMTVSLLFGTQAMAFDFTAGFISIVNFGFAAFVGVGAYTSGLLAVRMGISPAIGMFCGALTAGFLGFLVGALTLRLRGIYAAVMAWFLGLALMGTTTAMADLTRGNYGLSVPGLIDTSSVVPYYYVLLPLALAVYVLLQVIVRSRIGLAFRAIGQNIDAAQASGVQPHRYRILNFTVSCACAGLLGGFFAHYLGILTPSVMATDRTIEVLTLAYIGGRGSIWGGLLAAFLIIPGFEYLRSYLELRLIFYGVVLILVMLFYPSGLAGILRKLAGWAAQQRVVGTQFGKPS